MSSFVNPRIRHTQDRSAPAGLPPRVFVRRFQGKMGYLRVAGDRRRGSGGENDVSLLPCLQSGTGIPIVPLGEKAISSLFSKRRSYVSSPNGLLYTNRECSNGLAMWGFLLWKVCRRNWRSLESRTAKAGAHRGLSGRTPMASARRISD